MSPSWVRASAPAKINLHLGVGPVRPDGFHPLATVYQAVGLLDQVTVSPASTWSVTVAGDDRLALSDVPADGSNIAVRAAQTLARHAGLDGALDIRIDKGIPVAGGMAGGSADAAATLVACDTLWELSTPREELLLLAAELGSDVPFALVGGTAVGTGRGEVVVPAMVRGDYWWVVAASSAGLSTPAVYGEFDAICDGLGIPEPEIPDELMEALRAHDLEKLALSLHNDLEPAALRMRPALSDVLASGIEETALGALVSGSGPSCLFLCSGREHAQQVAHGLRTAGVGPVSVAQGPVGGARVERVGGAVVNLVSLERVHKAYGIRPLLADVSIGVGAGERIGVVGRNGDGKTTLLRVLAGLEEPDAGRVARNRGMRLGFLTQGDDLDPGATVREVVLGDRADHEWAADATTRETVEVLLAGVSLDRPVDALSGGERRRCSLARLLLDDHDLVVLDEPTNHLDVEAVAWLARHLVRRTSALVVVTHDRWFLDAVCERTWEVHDGVVDVYDGGYAAFVLAKAERQRQAAASESRRQNLMRKELAWLRRGAPARTSKPKFRIDAATALIEDEPQPRDRLALQQFATQRLGKDVVDLEDVDLVRGDRTLLERATWRLGPGDRVGLVGVNGAGKTSVLRLVAGELAPTAGRVRRGRTVALEHLTQALDDVDPEERVLPAVERIRRITRVAGGEVTATSMLERFGFSGDRLTARVGDLSGGERRRFQILRLLLSEPNVLLLDEPTNDLDIETLNVLEDFLDGWPGTLVVVSHDRYFLERVCDTVWALLDDGRVSLLPRGVDEYLERREAALARAVPEAGGTEPAAAAPAASTQELREARKAIARIDKQLARVTEREAALHAELAEHASDYERLAALDAALREVTAEKESLEEEWLEAAAVLE